MHVYVKSDYFHLSYKKRLPTPLSIVSLLSLHFMNRTTFQLVLQLTELTWKARSRKKCVNIPEKEFLSLLHNAGF